MAEKTKFPSKAEFAKMPKAEQDKWMKRWDAHIKNQPIVDPVPATRSTKKTAKKK